MVKFQPVWKEVESVSQLKILELLWVVGDKGPVKFDPWDLEVIVEKSRGGRMHVCAWMCTHETVPLLELT